jgi:hypothetical protein
MLWAMCRKIAFVLSNMGPDVQGDQFYEDRLSRGTGSGGPEVRESNGFRTKCVTAALVISKQLQSFS